MSTTRNQSVGRTWAKISDSGANPRASVYPSYESPDLDQMTFAEVAVVAAAAAAPAATLKGHPLTGRSTSLQDILGEGDYYGRAAPSAPTASVLLVITED